MASTPRDQSRGPNFEVGGKGVGGFSPQDVEQRAKELALIDGRSGVTEEDRERALAELNGGEIPDTLNDDVESMQSMSRDPSDPMVDRGRRVPDHYDVDEKTGVERLALEGVEEAQHDQMVQSRNFVDEPLRSRPGKKNKE